MTRTRLVVLLHGYNNNQKEAEEAYQAFYEVQLGLAHLANGDDISPDRNFLKVFWPGDRWGVLGVAYYPWAIAMAETSARVLANVLVSISSGGLDVEIVAHSLGCRLAFELMKQLNGRAGVTLTRVALMAAAVPTFMLEDVANPNSLHNAYRDAGIVQSLSLFSPADEVLTLAFPIGQTDAPGHEGFFPTALGHKQWVSPYEVSNLNQVEDRGSGHSDYWGWKLNTRQEYAVPAGTEIRKLLRFSRIGPMTTTTSSIPDRRILLANTPPVRDMQTRDTPIRAA